MGRHERTNLHDHLRNHGFILTEKGWILSPAFDLNPNEDGTGLSLNISLDDNSLNLEVALEVIDFFLLDEASALKIIKDVRMAVSRWRSIANRYQLSKAEQELMSNVFEKQL